MKKNNNRKGFTIVELVIVIAVIAILAAVLIPTFSGVVTKANESKALQNARNIYTNYIALHDYTTGSPAQDLIIEVTAGKEYVAVKDAQMQSTIYTSADAAAKTGAGITATTGSEPANDYLLVAKDGEGVSKTMKEFETN